jgi:hypothetical protein
MTNKYYAFLLLILFCAFGCGGGGLNRESSGTSATSVPNSLQAGVDSEGLNVTAVPPATAKLLINLEETEGWWSCTAPCSGGNVSENYSTSIVPSPTLNGNSREFWNGGGPYSNVLWVKKGLGQQNEASDFLWDFDFYLDEQTASTIYAMEQDLWLSQDGWEYMAGTQAHYPDGDGKPGHWDTWNQRDRHWVHNLEKVAPRFQPNTWHHLQWHIRRDHASHTYTYAALVIDGGTNQEQVLPFDQTQPAGTQDWADSFGVHWQLDLNKNGLDARLWVDNVEIALW